MHPYPAVGDKVGPYRIEGRLGGGEHGVVFAAVQASSGARVALKVMSPAITGDPATKRRLTLAARSAASVRSPHVARVYLYGEDNTRRLYIASELVAEGCLAQVLDDQGPAPVQAGIDLMAQLATGLAAAHARGLVHGALTPANVLLQWREGRAVGLLADVGTGWSATAPEVHLGSPSGVASDIHSMGALLWETLTGQPVHHGTPFQVAECYIKDPPPRLAGLSPQVRHLNQLLARAMHRVPERRHGSALELRDDLLAALALPGESGPLLRAPHPRSGPSDRTQVLTFCFALALMSLGLVAGAAMLMMSF